MFGKGKNRNRSPKKMKFDGESSVSNPNRHPPHLKGKAIGLFYAKRSKLKKQALANAPTRTLGTVLLSNSKKYHIQTLLDESDEIEFTLNPAFRKQFSNLLSGCIKDKLSAFKSIEPNPLLDENLFLQFQQQKESSMYKMMKERRKNLPSYEKRKAILKLIDENQVVVISGETGCGKTTQIPQFILNQHLKESKGSICNIVCTQPRRISAISVAERVAEERGESLGKSVGYHIRLEKRFPRPKGSITFCTTGIVLKQMESDPCLSNISHVILDEIHERDIMSDFLITLLKQVLPVRNDLKIILMSATLNSEKFSQYYDNCPHINIPGFTFPVQEFYLEDVLQRTGFVLENSKKGRNRKFDKEYSGIVEPYIRNLESEKKYSRHVCIELRNPQYEKINLDLILALLIDICRKEESGAILIFLPGFSQISGLNRLIGESGQFPVSQYLIIPLHSSMPTMNQKKVFNRPPNGVRKIVLATNIAETSITIDDVVYVIDCGKIKMKNFDVEKNTETLNPEWVSLANANQRKGRAGRVQAGVCFHLFTRAHNMILDQYQKPEILRSRLENTILTIKILQLGKAKEFLEKLMDPPKADAIDISLKLLKRLQALDDDENLTPLGCHLAKLPVSPQIGKMLLLSAIFSCVDPVLSVAASLDFKDAFQIPLGKQHLADKKKVELSGGCQSDHLLLYYALSNFENLSEHEGRQFCWEYFLSSQILKQLRNMKRQFMEYLYEMDFVSNSDPKCDEHNVNSKNMSLVKAIVCAGLYPNVATLHKILKNGIKIKIIEDNAPARIHPKSVLFRESVLVSPLLVYHLKLRSTEIFVHDATMIQPLALIFFGDNYQYNDEGEHTNISIVTNKLRFKCSRSTNNIITQLRDKLNSILEYKVCNPSIVNWQTEDGHVPILRAIIELITSEDIGDIDLEAYDDGNDD